MTKVGTNWSSKVETPWKMHGVAFQSPRATTNTAVAPSSLYDAVFLTEVVRPTPTTSAMGWAMPKFSTNSTAWRPSGDWPDLPPVRILTPCSHRHPLTTSTAIMASWAPELYKYYVNQLRLLYEKHPELKHIFPSSIFAAALYNFGP